MLNELFVRYPCLVSCQAEIQHAADALIVCYQNGGKVMACGNGGSCADADHIVGELMKGFLKKRPLSDNLKQSMKEKSPSLDDMLLSRLQQGLPALSLCSLAALNTAFCNDCFVCCICFHDDFWNKNCKQSKYCCKRNCNSKHQCYSLL